MNTGLDTISHYRTPEGVELSFSLAGPMVRGVAWLIDVAIRVGCYILFAIVFSIFGGVGKSLILIGLFLIEWFYPVFFEIRNGMTPGKKAMGLKVLHDNGTPVGWSSSLLRNLIRAVDILPLFNITGCITMLLNNRFQRLGDLAAGTVVVYVREEQKEVKIPEYSARPAPVPIRLEEQRLILDFCERFDDLSVGRRHELAQLLSGLTESEVPEQQLLEFGNWFLKGRDNHESAPV